MKGVDNMTIGQRIKSRRLELGMTVDELAHKLGKNRATVYRYENDEIKDMPVSVLAPLADVLLTTPAHLMGIYTENSEKDRLFAYFERLNPAGRSEALTRLMEMTQLEKYTKK